MWKTYALLSAVFAALTAILVKVGIKDTNPNLATAIRTTVILALTWGIVFFACDSVDFRGITKRNIFFLVASGLATGLSWVFYFKALETGDVSKVAPIDKLSVAFAILLAFIFLGEVPTAKTIIGGLLIVLGSLVIIL